MWQIDHRGTPIKKSAFALFLSIAASCCCFGDAVLFLQDMMPDRMPLPAVTGNGRLGASLDTSGAVVSVIWPGTGGREQTGLIGETEGPAPAGRWGVDFGEGVSWLDAPVWRVTGQESGGDGDSFVKTVSRLGESGIEAIQHALVPKDTDGLLLHLEIRGVERVPRVFWQGVMRPCTGHAPGLPLSGPAFPAAAGFAGFVSDDTKALFTFRPERLSAGEWDRARRLAGQGFREVEWDVFGGGVWVLMGGPMVHRAFFSMDSLEKGAPASLDGETAVFELRLQGTAESRSTWTGVAIAHDRATARAVLETLTGEGRVSVAGLSAVSEEGARAMRLLRQCQDLDSGMVVALPCGRPPLAFSWPSLGAWAAMAFSMNDARDNAARQLQALLSALQKGDAPGMPAGSMAPLLRPGGVAAFPGGVFNSADTAWVLLALRDVTAAWPKESRRELVERHWPEIELMADFLVRWSDFTTGLPVPGFDWSARRSASTFETLLMHLLAAGAAEELALVADREIPPDWSSWKRALDARTRFALANPPDSTPVSTALGGWIALHPEIELPPLFRGLVMADQAVPFESVEDLRRVMLPYLRGVPVENSVQAAYAAVFSATLDRE